MMVLTLALALTVSAEPAKTKVVVLGARAFDDTSERRALELQELLLTELSRNTAIEVIGQSDLAALVGVERQKQLMGCSTDGSSCMAEIGAALGAPYLVMGSVGKAGKRLRVDVKLIEVSSSKVIERQGEMIESDDDWYPTVTRMSRAIASAVPGARSAPVPAPTPAPAPIPAPAQPAPVVAVAHRPVFPWVLAGLGAAVAIGGGVMMYLGADASQKALVDKSVNVRTAASSYDGGVTLHSIGIGLVIGGAVVAAGGLVWGLLTGSSSESPPVSAWVMPGGAGVAWSWSFR